jgi:hypothetical protein
MNERQERSATDDLALIRSMMEAGRRRAAFDGTHLIIWGAVLTLAYLGQYLLVYDYIPGSTLWVWLPLGIVGTVFSFLHDRQRCALDHSDIAVRAYSGAWSAVGITMVLHFSFALASDALDPKVITVLACGIIAAAFHVISLATDVRQLRLVSAGWWAIMVFVTTQKELSPEILLVLSGASALLITLPGQLMKRLVNTEADQKSATEG